MPHDAAILLLGTYPEGLKAETLREISMPMFISALFAIAWRWKQTAAPTDGCVKRQNVVHTYDGP